MPRYLCPKCQKVFCGWAVKYKYKEKCHVCGGELREIYPDNKESRKVEGSHKEAPEDSLYRLPRIDIQAIRGLFRGYSHKTS